MRFASNPRIAALISACALLASTGDANGQTGLPGLLRDIAVSPTPQWAPLLLAPTVYVRIGGEVYFAAWDQTEGLELRATDGTAAGTRTVRDVCPGSCSGFWGDELIQSSGILYFVGDDGVHGRELWRSDGARANTKMVADIVPGPNALAPRFLTAAWDGLYFVGADAAHGSELWSSGMGSGTHLVADIHPSRSMSPDGGPSHLTWTPGGLVFAADDGAHGRELWLNPGPAAPSVMLADIHPGPADGIDYYQPFPDALEQPVYAGGKVFFEANDGVHGREPWVTDGTSAGTALLQDLVPGPNDSLPRSFFRFVNDVLFAADTAGFSRTLWRSNGTAAGTIALGDAAHGSADLRPTTFAPDGATVFFNGYQSATGYELWSTDGTLEGTQLVVETRPGPESGVSGLRALAAAEGRLWFPADDGVHGMEWWQSDGTAISTFQLDELVPGSGWSVDPWSAPKPLGVGGHVLLTVFDEQRGFAVRSAQPGVTGTAVVYAAGDRAGSAPFCLLANCPAYATPVSGGVAFTAADAAHGLEAWRSDGTDTGTSLVGDVSPGAYSGMFPHGTVRNLAPLQDDLLLIATDCTTTPTGGCGHETFQLWRATAQGALSQLTNEAWTLAPSGVASWNGSGFLGSSAGVWRSDGSPTGTSLLGGGPSARWFTPAADALYFSATDLWRTDGTPAGTYPLGGGAYSVTQRPVLAADAGGSEVLYFAASDAAGGNELWRSDGTDAGTRRVVDLQPGSASGVPTLNFLFAFEEISLVAAVGSRAFFTGDDGVAGEELWTSDGSPGNATLLEVRPGAAGSQPRHVTAAGGRVFFVADDGVHGREPWVTNGTAAGTHLVHDVRPGPESSTPRELTDWMGRLVFAADDDLHGMELWRAEVGGTGAQLVMDLRPGVEPASPQGLTAVSERLYFFADDGATGLEPWVWSAAAKLFEDGFESGSVFRWSRVTPP